jgi:hypothetical protein
MYVRRLFFCNFVANFVEKERLLFAEELLLLQTSSSITQPDLQLTTTIPDMLCIVPCLQFWGAVLCGFTSGSFGGLVAGVFEEGEAWMSTKCPTWPQQCAFYGVIAYYFLADPHGYMEYYLRPILKQAGVGDDVALFMSRAGSQAIVIMAMLILEFGLDCQGVDLLAPVNHQLSKAFSFFAPPRLRINPLCTVTGHVRYGKGYREEEAKGGRGGGRGGSGPSRSEDLLGEAERRRVRAETSGSTLDAEAYWRYLQKKHISPEYWRYLQEKKK